MKAPVFEGVATALITPLNENGIDYNAFARLIDWQINEGVNALVVCGTTGESSTLTDKEHKSAIEFAVNEVGGRIPVIAGTGSNDTAYALELTDFSCKAGVDGVLVVTPYYNKATQNGLFKMFTEIADRAAAPVILYNVPSRTGVNIAPETVARLSKHPNISGIKEAGGNISAVAEIAALCGDDINIYSGNDDQTVPIMSLGGKGCISVLSNLLPHNTAQMCKKMLAGDTKGALDLQLKYLPLIKALFCEVNPIPVKAAMAAMGYCENYLRLPLTPMEEAHKEILLNEMRKCGIKV
ncbi:MAG TPA: 4-hydroxy-tetrahydrodipicolinate synthase [Ruminococcaceae bacterium]|nr:4-hydroxy-tetrahydrodipicolinate synthase [Oscillospiraceae bacterium]